MVKMPEYIAKWNATDATVGHPAAWYGLGYEGKAAGMGKNQEIGFAFEGKKVKGDSVTIEVRWVPTHPVDNKLRFALSLDGGNPVVKEYQTKGRSEQWKVNTLQCQARVRIQLPIAKRKKHLLNIKALDDGMVLDQVYLY